MESVAQRIASQEHQDAVRNFQEKKAARKAAAARL